MNKKFLLSCLILSFSVNAGFDQIISDINADSPLSLENSIGKSVSFLSGKIYSSCLDYAPSGELIIVDQSGLESEVFIDIIHESFSSTEFKNRHSNFNASVSTVKFSPTYNKMSTLVSEVTNKNERTNLILSISNTGYIKRLKGDPVPKILDRHEQVLLPQTDESKREFRENCYDGYIHRVVGGKSLFVTISLESESMTLSERQEKTRGLQGALKRFTGSKDRAIIEEIKEETSGMRLVIKEVISGKEQDDIIVSSIDELVELIEYFEDPSTDDLTVVSYDVSTYPPVGSWEQSKSKFYLDVSDKVEKVYSWQYFYEDIYSPRCLSSNSIDSDLEAICNTTEIAIKKHVEFCSSNDMNDWVSCYAPNQNECLLESGQNCDHLKHFDVPEAPVHEPEWHTIYSGPATTNRINIENVPFNIRINGNELYQDLLIEESGTASCQGGSATIEASCTVQVTPSNTTGSSYVQGCFSRVTGPQSSQCNPITVTADGQIHTVEAYY
ncbi:hypothetical protein [Thaumasiovibrio subtropicus]|uniref:hypothetical protein n=1 Tax=Thaumasiovibrio subtropicus TaxID=1891207 RepID=UPI000B364975|nr:hypothetical protein [Thaumasiovibrio subtropicus]